jgi:PAS domain S-box-containing protein
MSEYRSLFVDSPLAMAVYDPQTLRIVAVNAAAIAMYGFSQEEFLARKIDELRPEEDRDSWHREVYSQPVVGLRRYTGRHCRKNGELFHIQAAANDIEFDGRPARVVAVTDVSDSRRAQEEIARLNAELEQRVQQRTAQLEAANHELETFAYSIAHDLRSPLTSIDGFSQSLEALCGDQLAEPGRHYLNRIRAGVRQMSDLTDAMLSLARLSRVQLRCEAVDLAQAARDALDLLREQQPGREVHAEIPARLPARGDPRLLGQVMTNLVANAWKFSGGKQRTEIRIGTLAGERGETVYFVADRGAGFDMAHASRLFGAFQRLHAPSEFEGTGIGLALVQKIVMRHGGRIWAQAAPGEGATFFFTLGGAAPVVANP